MDMDESITFQPADLLANDSASNGAALAVQDLFVVNLDQGTVTNNGDGSFTFVPTPGFAGFVQLRYVAAVAGLIPDPNSPDCVPSFTDEAVIRVRVRSMRVCNLGIEGIGLMCPGDNTGTIVLTALETEVPVEYSIDGFIWQDDNVFEGELAGTYRVHVREKDFTFCEATGFVTLIPVDTLAPFITSCPIDTVDVELDANGEFIPSLDFFGIEVSDNCTDSAELNIEFIPAVITAGIESIDLIAEDLNGNVDTCSININAVLPVQERPENLTDILETRATDLKDNGFDNRQESGLIAEGIDMRLYPNPARGVLNINLAGEKSGVIVIRDRLGRILWSQKVLDQESSLQINLNSRFPTGLYNVSLYSDKGQVLNKQLSIIK
jgi:hypothetical protein